MLKGQALCMENTELLHRGLSPPRGGFDPSDENQQLLFSESDESVDKELKRKFKKRRLKEQVSSSPVLKQFIFCPLIPGETCRGDLGSGRIRCQENQQTSSKDCKKEEEKKALITFQYLVQTPHSNYCNHTMIVLLESLIMNNTTATFQ
eukprot:g7940.t2